jgi:hypothetical protein
MFGRTSKQQYEVKYCVLSTLAQRLSIQDRPYYSKVSGYNLKNRTGSIQIGVTT